MVIAGGTGLVGKRLIAGLISGGHTVVVLTRGNKSFAPFKNHVVFQTWSGSFPGDWVESIEGADAVINLCGEGVANKRWTAAQKELLRSSRLSPTRALVQAMAAVKQKPKVFISASAVGYYGFDLEDAEKNEGAPRGKGFLAELCEEWENTAREAEASGVRVVLPRIGIVLERGSGALGKMVPPFEWLLGGPLGSGRQWFPWVHVQDLVSLIIFALHRDTVRGALNACSPNPVRMQDFCAGLGKVMKRPSWLPVPEALLKLLFGEMAEMLLGGQKATPKKAVDAGFVFRYPALEAALISVLRG